MHKHEEEKKRLVIGILAHVDAGKTTLCEGLLYITGKIRKQGRVDHGNAYLDTHFLEKAHGITIFSKQALISTEHALITLIDTPGHVDFSTEAERTLPILDYALLVISSTDGVQAHTETLWRLLRKYNIPTFIFINKMDLSGAEHSEILSKLHKYFGENCIDFSSFSPNATHGRDLTQPELCESIALCGNDLLDEFMSKNMITLSSAAAAVKNRVLFPCFFGSALKLIGISELIFGLEMLTVETESPEAFGAKVFKISRDSQGARLTHIRMTGGTLSVRDTIEYLPRKLAVPYNAQDVPTDAQQAKLSEKAAQIRVYSGDKFEQLNSISAGCVAAVAGLTATFPGLGLGFERNSLAPSLTPVLNYRIVPCDGSDPRLLYDKLKRLEEEEPQLNIVWQERLREIHAQLMGEVQLEILKSIIKERFDTDVDIDDGQIMYRETIAAPVEGIGHFEPLRHYAEVHLLLEPLEEGKGLVFCTDCAPNSLDINWQRLILTHLREKTHIGVLTGSPITDMKITLLAGRASLAHTEGGDFRQAAYRALRQGLMKAESILLEPYYEFKLELPAPQLGRAINDLRMMGSSFSAPESNGETACIIGNVPVVSMRGYTAELSAYTKGRGRLNCSVLGYSRCLDPEKVIKERGYQPEHDLENTPDSIFCTHGAGTTVKWNMVERYMHIDLVWKGTGSNIGERVESRVLSKNINIDDKELEELMLREFGPIKRREYGRSLSVQAVTEKRPAESAIAAKDYLIIDGYNMIFAWEGLRELAKSDIAAARKQLMDILSNYNGYKKCEILLIFDGYRVKGNTGERFVYHNIRVAYTKENETADMLIERLISEIGKNYSVRVATADGLIQLASIRKGVLRMTARELEKEVSSVNAELHTIMERLRRNGTYVKLNIPSVIEEQTQADVPTDDQEVKNGIDAKAAENHVPGSKSDI